MQDYSHAETITPTDNAPTGYTNIYKALSCLVSGEVTLVTRDNSVITIYLHRGTIFPVRFIYVKETGTTAQGIIGLR